jgi:hypothetical protein
MTSPIPAVRPSRGRQCNGEDCTEFAPGHAIPLIQERVAAATPSKWRDAIVTAVLPNGWLVLTAVDDGSLLRVWHHADLGSIVRPGEPVALHRVYNVLAVGSARFNTLVGVAGADAPGAGSDRG